MGKKNPSKELETKPLINFEELVNQAEFHYNGVINGESKTTIMLSKVYYRLLSKSISFPPYRKNDIEDQRLSKKIEELHWVTPEILEFPINLKDDRTCDCISKALHHLVQITTTKNPVKMLKYVYDCVQAVADIWRNNDAGADDLAPALIFIVLKASTNPPSLYSDMRFIAAFLRLNKQLLESRFYKMISDSEKVEQSGFIEYCFTSLLAAVEYINNVTGNAEKKTLKEGVFEQLIADEYYAEIDAVFERELDRIFEQLQRKIQELRDYRILIKQNHEEDMLLIADTLDTHNTNLHISKAVGSFFAIAGGIISFVGFGLMFTTFGVSAILIPVGASVGGAGGLTAGISGFVEYGIKKSNAKKIKGMREVYELKLVEVFETMKEIEVVLKSRSDKAKAAFNSPRPIFNTVDVIMKLVRISVASEDVVDGVNTAFRLAAPASRSLAIAGVVFSAVLLPIDIAFFGISIRALSTSQRCEYAEGIRNWLNQDLPSDDKISTALDLLKNAILEYGRNAKVYILRDSNKIDVEKCEKKLNEAFENVKKIINSD